MGIIDYLEIKIREISTLEHKITIKAKGQEVVVNAIHDAVIEALSGFKGELTNAEEDTSLAGK